MDIELLRLFVQVIRKSSFAAAARDQGAAPSSISRSIAILEQELGVRLFNRTTRRMSLTEAGEVYYRRVAPIVDSITEANAAAKDAGKQPEGRLRILAPAGFAQTNILPVLPQMVKRFPLLTYEFILTDENVDLVENRIDVAIRLWPVEDNTSIVYRLCNMTHVVCASPSYLKTQPIARPEDLEARRCLVLRHSVYRSEWRFDDSEKSITLSVTPLCIISNASALRECALLGLGPTLIPRWIVGKELADGDLIDLFPSHNVTPTAVSSTAAYLIYPSKAYTPLKVRIFVDALKELFKHGAPGERPLLAKEQRKCK